MGSCSGRARNEILYSMALESKSDGESWLYRNSKFSDELITQSQGLSTLQEVFQYTLKRFPNKNCLGSRNPEANNSYQFKSYKETNEIIQKLGSGIINLGLPVKAKYKEFPIQLICVFCKNREEWLLLDFAAVHYGFQLFSQTLKYDTLRVDDIQHILNETELTTIFLSSQSLNQFIKLPNFCKIKNVILLDEKDPKTHEIIQNNLKDLNVLSYNQVIQQGAQKILPFVPVTADTPFTFCYTSGTTGLPKGAVLCHKPLTAFMPYVDSLKSLKFNSSEVHLSYLPLPHIFERTITWAAIYVGGTVCFYGGDVQKLTQDLKDVKPTFFISVPRLFNRIYAKMQEEIGKLSGLKKMLVSKAISTKFYNLERYGEYKHYFYDKIVFSKMKQALGGNLKMMVSASAPITPEIVKFLQIVISGPIIECYGLSETGPLTTTEPFDNQFGHVGGPMPSQEIKLVDVPEMNYFSSNQNEHGVPIPQGELCSHSPCNFLGYYKNQELTQQVIDSNGFFHTGDIAEILPSGGVRIIDRKKNIFKLQQGEYVAVEKVENIYSSIPGILQAFIYGDSFKAYLVGIIVPDQKYIASIAKNLNIEGSFEELTQNEKIIEVVHERLIQEGKKANFYGFEQARVIALETTLFDLNNLLSTTFKLIRGKAKEFYQKKIDELYAKKINFA